MWREAPSDGYIDPSPNTWLWRALASGIRKWGAGTGLRKRPCHAAPHSPPKACLLREAGTKGDVWEISSRTEERVFLRTEVSDSNAMEAPAGNLYTGGGWALEMWHGGSRGCRPLSEGQLLPGVRPALAKVKWGPTVHIFPFITRS